MENKAYMDMAAKCGITTMLDMGVRDPSVVDQWRDLPDAPSLLSSCGVIYAPGSNFAKHMKFPEDMVCGGIDDVERIVDDRIRQGADYIKLIFENSARKESMGITADCEFPLDDRGTIEPGKRADLLLVEGKPDENIADIRNVKAVFKKGVKIQ